MRRLGNMSTQNGQLQGAITDTKSSVSVNSINLQLDTNLAWSLCNLLSSEFLRAHCGRALEDHQIDPLVNLGAAIGALIDHPNRTFEHLRDKK
jgi:hypothetical protein